MPQIKAKTKSIKSKPLKTLNIEPTLRTFAFLFHFKKLKQCVKIGHDG